MLAEHLWGEIDHDAIFRATKHIFSELTQDCRNSTAICHLVPADYNDTIVNNTESISKQLFITPLTSPAQHIDGSVQDCSNSIANALELLQSCGKPSICRDIDNSTLLALN